jgi:hypothetical protein
MEESPIEYREVCNLLEPNGFTKVGYGMRELKGSFAMNSVIVDAAVKPWRNAVELRWNNGQWDSVTVPEFVAWFLTGEAEFLRF